MWRVYYFDKSLHIYLPVRGLNPYKSNSAAKVHASILRKRTGLVIIVLPL